MSKTASFYIKLIVILFIGITGCSGVYNNVKNDNQLILKADSLLAIKPFSVVNKTGLPPSKNKHDYMSIGPYLWPNPDTPNGLPYIRKDGLINPETRNNFTDYTEKDNFFSAVNTLTKAYKITNKSKYAYKNIALIKTWFLDEETKINPNVNYGQYVPGRSEGRCFGIIEFEGLTYVLQFLEIAKANNFLDSQTEKGLQSWFTEYVNWLKKSDLGKKEATRKNNHATHYDVQLLSILVYLDKNEEVKNYLSTITKARIFSQIEPNGSQPLELLRTKAFSYSVMNLRGFLKLVIIGNKVGVNLWEMTSKDGRSIKKGCRFLVPYLLKEKKWPYKQIKSTRSSEEKLIKDLKYISKTLKDTSFNKVLEQLNQKNKTY